MVPLNTNMHVYTDKAHTLSRDVMAGNIPSPTASVKLEQLAIRLKQRPPDDVTVDNLREFNHILRRFNVNIVTEEQMELHNDSEFSAPLPKIAKTRIVGATGLIHNHRYRTDANPSMFSQALKGASNLLRESTSVFQSIGKSLAGSTIAQPKREFSVGANDDRGITGRGLDSIADMEIEENAGRVNTVTQEIASNILENARDYRASNAEQRHYIRKAVGSQIAEYISKLDDQEPSSLKVINTVLQSFDNIEKAKNSVETEQSYKQFDNLIVDLEQLTNH